MTTATGKYKQDPVQTALDRLQGDRGLVTKLEAPSLDRKLFFVPTRFVIVYCRGCVTEF